MVKSESAGEHMATGWMNIILNGQPRQVAAATIAQLLREVQAPGHGVAVALNGEVVPRAQLKETPVHEHDTVELIYAVQGG